MDFYTTFFWYKLCFAHSEGTKVGAICKPGRCSTVLQSSGTLWNAWNTCPILEQCETVQNDVKWHGMIMP